VVIGQPGSLEQLGTRGGQMSPPDEPAIKPFVPGHWLRMYGVMVVVPDLEQWEAAPTMPRDPLTKQPFEP
jgi:hypothetical protein